MTTLLVRPDSLGNQQPADVRRRLAPRGVRVAKAVCAAMLAVAFWFAVPYRLPLKLSPDRVQAAANEAAAYQGSLSREIAIPAVLMIATYMLWRLPKRGRIEQRGKLLLAGCCYLGWAASSYLWSTDPGLTCKRLIVLFVDIVLMYAVARCASMLEIALFGFLSTGAVALISLGVDLVLQHNFAPFNPDYRLTGVMTANFQAMNLVVCLLCGATVLQARPRWARWLAPALVAFAVLLLLTRARVGTFLCVGMLAAVFRRSASEYLRPRTRNRLLIAGLLATTTGFAALSIRSGGHAITEVVMMGRSDAQNTASLSNRVPLWKELLRSVKEHPVAGFGYQAFWSADRVKQISLHQGWIVPHAHDTYLDETLSLGFVGAVLYASTLWGGCVLAWRRYRRCRSEESLLAVLLLAWLALLGLSESVPVSPNLPTLIAYTCLMKLFLVEGTDRATEPFGADGEVLAARSSVCTICHGPGAVQRGRS